MIPSSAGGPDSHTSAWGKPCSQLSFHPRISESTSLQCRPLLLLSLILFRKHTAQRSLLLVIRQLSDPAGGLPGRQPARPPSPHVHVVAILLFLPLLIHSLRPLAQESGFPNKAEKSFLNCVYLLALWCESALRQLHINLVSSVYLFSSASVPLPNLWLAFPCFLLSQ